MREKTESFVLAVDLKDPNTTKGVVDVMKNYNSYSPSLTECGNVRQKVAVMGNTKQKSNKVHTSLVLCNR